MFCCANAEEKDERGRSKKIDKCLKDVQKKRNEVIRLLLLGTAESGKTTFFKQMKIIAQGGFKHKEACKYKVVIYLNIIEAAKSLIEYTQRKRIPLESEDHRQMADFVLGLDRAAEIDPELARTLFTLWQDQGIRQAFGACSEFQPLDSASYFFDRVEEVGRRGYVPSTQDILRSRLVTRSIFETNFEFGDLRFQMVDVGGQRVERKKWIHCFTDVTAIIFFVAVSEYDQQLLEDPTQNRMHESLILFRQICNSSWFRELSIILFLNKKDIFAEKVRRASIACCFPDYRGPQEYRPAIEFIAKKFKALNKFADRKQVYPYFTCATDTENIKRVFHAVRDIILKINMRVAGLI
eukprot:gnl/Chilomastix_cuspidata/691.p2 GENE.gnl/Chilomastix_cuspidata/691~~gnl/Chilomastix_cuspidata/691.p2  ORF type:complete len:352 (+),score=170.69 gnl/Chilomastix_cuspidata/691:55-1110(+)